LEVQVALDPVLGVIPNDAAVAQVDNGQLLGLDDFTARSVVGRNLVGVKIAGVEQ
jgi:hypothetical protein